MQLALPPMEIQRDCQGRGCDRKATLSLRAKYVNELYADIFSKTYGLETIGLRYFNVLVGNKILTEPTAVIRNL
jgi:nucleoside-diphosphate-sugar epimerase